MSRFALLTVLAPVLAIASPARADTAYFAAIEDLPMPAGFAELAASTTFDAAGGRLVLAQARGDGAPAAVRSFYLETLPALGWSYSPGADELVFLRGRERLSLHIVVDGAEILLRVELIRQATPVD